MDKKVTDFYKLDGVKDITPMKARGFFAKALMLEHNAGETTAEALVALDAAIAALAVGGE